jgi:non-ribosomal peptide synthetase component F
LCRLADELGVTASSVLLAAHAKVLAALSGEREVATGYVGRQGGQPLLCGLTAEPDSWRALLLAAYQAESELLAHSDFPVDDLRRELRLTEPSFETVLDPTGLDMRAEPFDRLRTALVEARPSTGSGHMSSTGSGHRSR